MHILLSFRFKNFNEIPLKSFRALDYRWVPSERVQLARYGKEDINTLIDHMPTIFSPETDENILTEYNQVKVHMRKLQYSQETLPEVYTRLLRASNSRHIEILNKLMLVVSPSTAECEREFSCMKLIKTHTRNTMTQGTLQLLMTVKQLGTFPIQL